MEIFTVAVEAAPDSCLLERLFSPYQVACPAFIFWHVLCLVLTLLCNIWLASLRGLLSSEGRWWTGGGAWGREVGVWGEGKLLDVIYKRRTKKFLKCPKKKKFQYSCFTSDLIGEVFNFSPISIKLAMCSLYYVEVHSIPNFFRTFKIKEYKCLLKNLFCIWDGQVIPTLNVFIYLLSYTLHLHF